MKQTQLFLLLGSMVGALYLAKNLKVSVTGAEAISHNIEEFLESSEEDEETHVELKLQETKEKVIREVASIERAPESPMAKMVEFLKDQRLCDFLNFSRQNQVTKGEQYKALTLSFNDPEIKDLGVFLDPSLDHINDYQSDMAKAFIFGTKQNAFNSAYNSKLIDYDKGLSDADKELMNLQNRYLGGQKKNLFFALLKNNVYTRYKNLPDGVKQELFDRVMRTSYYNNPAFEMLRRVYNKSKSNVAQFHLAFYLFNKVPHVVDRSFVQRTIWTLYDPEMRDHLADLFQKHLEANWESSKSFGYEPDIYYAYRHSVPYNLYESLLPLEDYDKTRDQPVYQLADLALDTTEECDQQKVQELATKLRAL